MSTTVTKIEYIWIDAKGNMRSKTRVHLGTNYLGLRDVPVWNYDGSSTGQANGDDSEVILKPKKIVPDPFRRYPHLLVLCDTWLVDNTPHPTNTRQPALLIFNQAPKLKPRFGIEQEFFLSNPKTLIPIGFPDPSQLPRPQADYYCGVGGNAIGRPCIEEAFDNCLKAGLNVTGLNAEVAPSQWEFQVDSYGIDVGDQLYLMRYIINRTAEKYGYYLELHPKPVKGNWNGSGCHTNFSTKPMRADGGYQVILDAIQKLEAKHKEHIAVYGQYNDQRLTGKHETASIDKFSYGVADRGASIRIPQVVEHEQSGYLEDRRPASNMDPYVVTSKLFSTTSLTD